MWQRWGRDAEKGGGKDEQLWDVKGGRMKGRYRSKEGRGENRHWVSEAETWGLTTHLSHSHYLHSHPTHSHHLHTHISHTPTAHISPLTLSTVATQLSMNMFPGSSLSWSSSWQGTGSPNSRWVNLHTWSMSAATCVCVCIEKRSIWIPHRAPLKCCYRTSQLMYHSFIPRPCLVSLLHSWKPY